MNISVVTRHHHSGALTLFVSWLNGGLYSSSESFDSVFTAASMEGGSPHERISSMTPTSDAFHAIYDRDGRRRQE